jgi:hypothetical protein
MSDFRLLVGSIEHPYEKTQFSHDAAKEISMLHGTALKAVIWCLTIIGLTPAMVLAVAALAFGWLSSPSIAIPPEEASGTRLVLRSSTWFQIGPIRIDDWHPRVWAAAIIAVGIVLIMLALFALLHVPREA